MPGVKGLWNREQVERIIDWVGRLREPAARAKGADGRTHMLLEAACNLLDARAGVLVVGVTRRWTAGHGAVRAFTHGLERAVAQRVIAAMIHEGAHPVDPAARHLLDEAMRSPENHRRTTLGHHLVDGQVWSATDFARGLLKPCGLGEGIYSATVPGQGQVACIGLWRPARSRRRFTPADVEMLDLLHAHGANVYREEELPPGVDGHQLSPRKQETFWKLLDGQGEKQIAVEMGLSPNTVHHYVKAIYRHFNVSSRAELLAWWMQQPRGR